MKPLWLALLASSLFAQVKPVTLEVAAVHQPDRPARLEWAPSGQKFLYSEQTALMLYDCATGQRTELANTKDIQNKAKDRPAAGPFNWQNRRVAAGRPEWSDDEKSLLLATGGDLFLYDIAAKQWLQLTATPEEEEDAHLSPDGRHVAFRRLSDLYVIEVTGKKERRLTQDGSPTLLNGKLDWVYPEELELGRAWWWSPDSKSIAYLQFDVAQEMIHPHVDSRPIQAVYEPQRFPKAGTPNANVRLGILSARGGKTKWMDLGPTADKLIARVDWLPSSKALAVQRLSRVQDHLELLSVDSSTGRTQLLLEEKDAAWVNLHDALRFFPDGRFLWASERSGYQHLYLYSATGQLERQLTSGDWEVTDVDGADSANIYFTATKESPLERHLYRVPLAGGDVTKLTREPGTHSASMSPTAAYYVDNYSSLTLAPQRTVYRATGEPLGVFKPRPPAEYALLPIEPVTFTYDKLTFYGQVIKPANFDPAKKYPAIVMVYGGPHAQTVRNMWAGANWEQALAARGFVIWRMDNRGAGGRGHTWETPLHRQFGKTELADQVAGVDFLVRQGYVDAKRVGMYGWSYGGYMTLYSLANAPQTFASGVSGAPVTDWRHYDTIYTERYMGLPSRNEDGYRESSAVTHAAKITGKLLLVHNFQDDNVLFQNAQHMIEALQRSNKQFELMFYQQKSHGVTGTPRRHLLETTTSFFERTLQP